MKIKTKLFVIFITSLISMSFGFMDIIIDNPYANKVKIYLPTQNTFSDSGGEYFWHEVPTTKKHQPKMTDFGISTKYVQLKTYQGSVVSSDIRNMIMLGTHFNWHINPNIHIGWEAFFGVNTFNNEFLKMGYTGLDFQWISPSPFNELQLYAGCLLGLGAIEYQTTTTQQRAFWIAEPKIGLKINFSDYVDMRIVASYLFSDTAYNTFDQRAEFNQHITGTISLHINLL